MLNLLRSDLYRITRIRGAGELMVYGFICLLIYLAIIAVAISVGLLTAGSGWMFIGSDGHSVYSVAIADISLSGHLLPVLCCLAMSQVFFAEVDAGYEKSVNASIRGPWARVVERVALAGTVSFCLTALTMVAGVATYLVGTCGTGTFDAAGSLLLWFLEVWFACWAYSLPPLIISWLTRRKMAGYLSVLYATILPNILFLLASALDRLWHTPVLTGIYQALAPFGPGTLIGHVADGAGAALSAGTSAPFAFPGGFAVQAVVVLGVWAGIATAAGLAIVSRRRG